MDFASLQEMNPDIYAWLYIPETDISYPILQSGDGDDEFYLNHDSTGKSSRDGSIFTQGVYNAKDFNDPVTLVYGHHMRSGAMFGNLQEIYSAQGGLKAHQAIVVYLPDRELRYQVFAAVPHDMRHIHYEKYYEIYAAAFCQSICNGLLRMFPVCRRVAGRKAGCAGEQGHHF